jgi:hypothetical protein
MQTMSAKQQAGPDEVDDLAKAVEALHSKQGELIDNITGQIEHKIRQVEQLKAVLREAVGDELYTQIMAEKGWDRPTDPAA